MAPRRYAHISMGVLRLYFGGALSPSDQTQLEEHLAGCTDCAEHARGVFEGYSELPTGRSTGPAAGRGCARAIRG